MADIEKYLANVKKYSPSVNEGALAGIVRHLGIALRNRDASLVSGTDPEELKRVRESWLKKKLQLTESDDALDKAIASVIEKMKADRQKERVTVYYLLAEHYKKLDSLVKAPAAPKKSAASAETKPAAASTSKAKPAADAPSKPVPAKAPAKAAAKSKA